MIREELSGNCARENLANTTRLIFMPEPYPCYPFNPWFVSDFQKIGVSFAAKNRLERDEPSQ